MSKEGNVCGVCGGLKGSVSREFLDHLLRSAPYMNPLFFRACSCKPEPAQKHDGKLDGYEVGYGSEWDIQGIRIKASEPSVAGNDVFLLPARALSLLAWLTQERGELERLAKEQEQ